MAGKIAPRRTANETWNQRGAANTNSPISARKATRAIIANTGNSPETTQAHLPPPWLREKCAPAAPQSGNITNQGKYATDVAKPSATNRACMPTDVEMARQVIAAVRLIRAGSHNVAVLLFSRTSQSTID